MFSLSNMATPIDLELKKVMFDALLRYFGVISAFMMRLLMFNVAIVPFKISIVPLKMEKGPQRVLHGIWLTFWGSLSLLARYLAEGLTFGLKFI